MLKLQGTPIIQFSLESIATTNITDVAIVVGYRADDIVNTYGNSYRGKSIKYVVQGHRKGLVHAIECAREFIGREDFLLLLGDEILVNPRHEMMLRQFRDENLFGLCGMFTERRIDRISRTYAVFQDETQKIWRLIEKPKRPPNSWMGTGSCVFRNELLSYIDQTPINPNRHERELPDLIQCAVDEGHLVKSFPICEAYFNINSDEDLQEAQRSLPILV